MKNRNLFAVLSALLFFAVEGVPRASVLVRVPAEGQTLTERLAWAQKRAETDKSAAYTVAYSISRMMFEGSSFSVNACHSGDGERLLVKDLLEGKTRSEQNIKPSDMAKRVLRHKADRQRGEKRPSDVVLFFKMERKGGTFQIREMKAASLDAWISLDDIPLYWLSRVDNAESLSWLETAFMAAKDHELLEDLVAAIGLHQEPGLVLPLLKKALAAERHADVREAAVFWLGEQEAQESVDLLTKLLQRENDEDILDAVVFSLSRIELETALNELVALAKGEGPVRLRRKAIFWLSQKAAKKACSVLEEIAAAGNEQTAIREHAVFALSQHEGGVDALIKLAKGDGSPKVRKKAIFWLGQCDDPRAVDTIVDILEK